MERISRIFLGISDRQLRYFSLEGIMLPTLQETAKNEIVRANQSDQIDREATQRAEQESQRAEQVNAELQKLKEKVRSLSISIE